MWETPVKASVRLSKFLTKVPRILQIKVTKIERAIGRAPILVKINVLALDR